MDRRDTGTSDGIEQIQAWFAQRCNGEWEHQFGITIETLDNPGWRVRIDLAGTPWERSSMEVRELQRADQDWWRVWVEGEVFNGAGGTLNLTDVLNQFLVWTHESNSPPEPPEGR